MACGGDNSTECHDKIITTSFC